MVMQNIIPSSQTGYVHGPLGAGQIAQNQFVSVPTENRFAPLGEWVGYSMDINNEDDQMDIQWVPVRNKRRRFNTGSPGAGTVSDQINFSSLTVNEKLSQMFDKLNILEQSNQEIMRYSQQIDSVKAKVNSVEQRTVNHEQLLKVLAYKSIDIEARSRRNNLIIHGLAESNNECLSDTLHEFLWNELGVDSEDLYINRYHRLGSLHKAKRRQQTDMPRRPIILAFQDYKDIGRILDAAYMLRGSRYSITKDYPKEIVAARQRLMPQYKAERLNRNNRVSIEYPAKLLVNGRVVADEFPDWYQVLEHDRYQLACGNYPIPTQPRSHQSQPVSHSISQQVLRDAAREAGPQSPTRSYAQVVVSSAQQQQSSPSNMVSALSARPVNIPRYSANNAGNQNVQDTTRNTTTTFHSTTATTTNSTTSNASMNLSSNCTGSRDIPTYTNL